MPPPGNERARRIQDRLYRWADLVQAALDTLPGRWAAFRRRRGNPLLWLERLLMAVGLVCLGTVAYAVLDARWFAFQQGRRFDAAVRARAAAGRAAGQGSRAASPGSPAAGEGSATWQPGTGGPVPPPATETDQLGSFRPGAGGTQPAAPSQGPPPPPAVPEGTVIGRIKVPRVGVTSLVLEGVADETLRRGVGHIPGTPVPERGGNVGLAGHRDTVFRGLKDIRKGDVIIVDTLDDTYLYYVDWAQVVDPQDVGVLAAGNRPELTLVTCYPFYYVGSAPERFVVRAHLAVGGAPGAPPDKGVPVARATPN